MKLLDKIFIFLCVVAAPVFSALIETLSLWPEIPKYPALGSLMEVNPWKDVFWPAPHLPVGILSIWMIIVLWPVNGILDKVRNRLAKTTLWVVVAIVTNLLLWLSIIWAIYETYLNVGAINNWFLGLPGLPLRYWMGGFCIIWSLCLALLFFKFLRRRSPSFR